MIRKDFEAALTLMGLNQSAYSARLVYYANNISVVLLNTKKKKGVCKVTLHRMGINKRLTTGMNRFYAYPKALKFISESIMRDVE